MSKQIVVSREEIEAFGEDHDEGGKVTWLYNRPFDAHGIMYGPCMYVASDELLGLAEQYLDDCDALKVRALRFVYDGDGHVAGILCEEVVMK